MLILASCLVGHQPVYDQFRDLVSEVLYKNVLEELRVELLLPRTQHLVQLRYRVGENDFFLLILFINIIADVERYGFERPFEERDQLLLNLFVLLN